MATDLPGKPANFPQITVVISGLTQEASKTNGEDATSTATTEEGDQVVHKDVAGILSRRTLALEVRIDKIEREIRNIKSNFNGRLTRIEDKMKTLLKGQEEILSKMEELERVRPVVSEAVEQPSVTHDTSVDSNLESQQKSKRVRVDEYLATSCVARALRGRARYRRLVRGNAKTGRSKTSLVKYYRRMQAKQAAQAVPSPATSS